MRELGRSQCILPHQKAGCDTKILVPQDNRLSRIDIVISQILSPNRKRPSEYYISSFAHSILGQICAGKVASKSQ
jgi:hypothetical protein